MKTKLGKTRPVAGNVSDGQIRALLDRYSCPVPFHAARTRFLGNIASPSISITPMDKVKALWGGELPVFDSLDAANEFLAVLIMGLWNRLARHQDRRTPFRLTRYAVSQTQAGIAKLALVQRQELDGFVYGLFGEAESLELPERAHRALEVLANLRSFWEAMRELASNPTEPATADDISKTLAKARAMTRIGEHEINEAVLSCTRARRQMLDLMSVAKPTVH